MRVLRGMARALLAMTTLLAGAACDDGSGGGTSGVEPAGGGDVATEWPYFGDERYYVRAEAHANVLRSFTIPGEIEPGVAWGFDLDGVDTPEGELESCGHGDLVDPEGRDGIDNQMARIWVMVEPLVGEAVLGLLQGAINEGRFLLIVELDGVDDFVNDDSVTLRLFRGQLDPEIGTLGLVSPDQTYFVDYTLPISVAETAIVDGEVWAGGVEFTLPIDILEANFLMEVKTGEIRLDIAEDGTFTGLIGGAVSVSQFIGELANTDASAETELVRPFFEDNADMGYDGERCDLFSVAFSFTGTTAFVVHDAEAEPLVVEAEAR